jgi:hypothetical protein
MDVLWIARVGRYDRSVVAAATLAQNGCDHDY